MRKNKKKLVLAKELVRNLQPVELLSMRGGMINLSRQSQCPEDGCTAGCTLVGDC